MTFPLADLQAVTKTNGWTCEVLKAGERGLSETIHLSIQGWLIMLDDEKRLSLSTEERCSHVGLETVAASQKAAGVETRTASPLFEPGCARHSEILFRLTAVFCDVIQWIGGFLFLLGISTSAGNLDSTPLLSPTLFAAGGFWTRYQQGVRDTLCYVISGSGAPATSLTPLGLMGHRAESAGFPQKWLLFLK